MKKIIIRFSLTFLLVAAFFSSCKLTISDEKLFPKPTCEITEDVVTISVSKHSSNTSYINIYRQDVDLSSTINIGIIYPSAFSSGTNIYTFKDSLIVKTHKYKYYARYYIDGEYKKTDWSDEIVASDGYLNVTDIQYALGSASFVFNEDDSSLTLHGSITPPSITDFATKYSNMLILQNSNSTKVFKIGNVSDGDSIYLKNILPSDFIGKNITILGICGQRIESVSSTDNRIKNVIWTESIEVDIDGISDNTISIPENSASNGLDYSRQLNKN